MSVSLTPSISSCFSRSASGAEFLTPKDLTSQFWTAQSDRSLGGRLFQKLPQLLFLPAEASRKIVRLIAMATVVLMMFLWQIL